MNTINPFFNGPVVALEEILGARTRRGVTRLSITVGTLGLLGVAPEAFAKAKKNLAKADIMRRVKAMSVLDSICGGGPYYCGNTGPTRECQIVCDISPACADPDFCDRVLDSVDCDALEGKQVDRCKVYFMESCRFNCGLRPDRPVDDIFETKGRKRRGRR